VKALSNDGFEECQREMTTTRCDWQPPGGVWQGVDTRTGSVASAIWVDRPAWDQAIVFIAVDGEPFRGAKGHDDLQVRIPAIVISQIAPS